MEFAPIPFYIISVFILACAVGVVMFRELIYSALSMVACFLGVAAMYILLHAELVAGAQVLIYVGAISILVIFAIMLTRHRKGDFWLFYHKQSLLALPVAIIGGGAVIAIMARANFNTTELAQNPSDETIAQMLFNEYAFPFEMVSLVLLVAIVGAILLAKKEKQ
ncbi:MAG: NADH-quinone oxidoreductase subunit J family protein [Thermoleophilia bacterium]